MQKEGENVAEKRVQTDMTVGNPVKIILNFTIPIFIGNLFQQFYSMADTIIVGKFVGTKALGSRGKCRNYYVPDSWLSAGTYRRLFRADCSEIRRGDMKGMRKTVGTAAVLSWESPLY